MNVPVVSHLKLLVNLYNKMNNRFLVLLVIYLIIYLLSVLYKNKQIFCAILLSLLSWERGLKYSKNPLINLMITVAPLVGAWIEINLSKVVFEESCVAPLVGAWIEIKSCSRRGEYTSSLLSWERGLKSNPQRVTSKCQKSLLSWERGLKLPSYLRNVGAYSRSSRGSVD